MEWSGRAPAPSAIEAGKGGLTQQSNGYTAMSLRLHLPTSSRASPGACLLVVAASKQVSQAA